MKTHTWRDPERGRIAKEVCTSKEYLALKYSDAGWGYRTIGNWLGISTSTARDRVVRARKKVDRAQEQPAEERDAA